MGLSIWIGCTSTPKVSYREKRVEIIPTPVEGLYIIPAPDDYAQVTGYRLNVTLEKMGERMGGGDLAGLFVIAGNKTTVFISPGYLAPYLGGMFTNGEQWAEAEFAAGEAADVEWMEKTPLFTTPGDALQVVGNSPALAATYGTFALNSVTWIYAGGEAAATADPVPVDDEDPFDSTAGQSMVIAGKGDGLFWINAATGKPEDYKKITGFKLTYKLLKSGQLGNEEMGFYVNPVMIASGAASVEGFGMDYSSTPPKYVGPAKEIITQVTGNADTESDTGFIGPMFFKKGTAEGMISAGDTSVIIYEGETAMFSDRNSYLSVYGMFGAEVEILGIEWIYGEINAAASSGPTWRPVETITYNDVPTVQNPSGFNYVNIMVPKGAGPYPVVFWIHGGGWSALNRTSFFISDTRDYLLYKGFAIVSADYTLSRQTGDGIISGYPQMIYDLKAAVRFVRANAEKYNLDTSFIAAMGESAGGHLSMLMGTTNGNRAYEDLTMGNANFSSDVQAMVSYFGPSDAVGKSSVLTDLLEDPFGIMGLAILGNTYTEALAKQVSPCWQITSAAPPLFLTHGRNDQTVPVEHSYKMEQKAKEVIGTANVTAIYYDNAPHANIAAFDKQSAMEAVEAFLTKVKSTKR
jgi:acetyl esterase/lipase